MQHPNSKVDSQSRVQQRKFQYFTGGSTSNNLTVSSIDQHRNSIEQRIANLQTKLAKKFNPELEAMGAPQTQSESYVNTRRMYQYSGVSSEPQNYIPANSQSHQHPWQKNPVRESGFSQSRQDSSKGKTFKYLANLQKNIDDVVLREKIKFSSIGNNHANQQQQKMQPKEKLKAVLQKSSDKIHLNSVQKPLTGQTKERMVGKKIKNVLQPRNQNTRHQQQRKYQSSQKFDRKYPLSHNLLEHQQPEPQKSTQPIPRSNPILNGRYFQEFSQLNTNISTLKHYTGESYPFENYHNPIATQSRTISYDTGVDIRQNSKNNELYEMMKSIMVGQQRLEKELMMIKNTKQQEDRPLYFAQSGIKNTDTLQKYNYAQRDKAFSLAEGKKTNVPESRISSPIQERKEQKYSQANKSRSPQINNQKSRSPRAQKSKSPVQNKSSNQTSAIKRKRANSAVVNKKLPGKIQKNKQRFDELYKQAQINKRLGETSSRIIVSKEAVSSVWQKIKQSITRAESQDTQTSVIYHENNRWVNDHLVSKIELQKKLKNDLVKKVYDMCENKCLYK